MTPVELVLAKLPDAKRNGKGWYARCPAHDDRKPSLSISEGDDGRALVHCHAGCSPEVVCGKIDLRIADLMPEASTVYGNGRKPERKHNSVDKRLTEPSGPTFATAAEAVADLERRLGPRSALWTYHDAEGKPCAVVVRWDRPEGGKDIRPVARIDGGWRQCGMPEPRPLYCLPDLATSKLVYVCEGEKAADAVRSLGLTATTSAHGSQSADKTDWKPLADKTVIILPDRDDAGRKYADDVAAILGKLKPRPIVKVVELPDLRSKGDAVEWIADRGEQSPEAIRAELERLVDEAEAVEPERLAEPLRFVPFPVDAIPQPLRGVVCRASKALGCDPSFIVLPLLTALAAAIGNTRRLLLKAGWEVPAIVWTAIVAPSGAVKSPCIDVARRPVEARQKRALKQYRAEREAYEAELLEHQRDLRNYQNGKRGEAPKRPIEPVADRYWCDDVTIEAVAARLQSQPRGLLLLRDELSGWFGGFDRYVGGKGGDASKWLEAFGGRPMLVDRKGGEPIHIPRAAVCITGSIQPGILKQNLTATHRQNGLAARMLFSYPPRQLKCWTEDGIEPRDHATVATIFERLYQLSFGTDVEAEPAPIAIRPTPEAKASFVEYFNEHNGASADLTEDLGAAWSKLEEYAARLALVVHCVRWAADDRTLDDEMKLDAASMTAGITLARWFGREARRIYAMLDEGAEARDRRKLIEWIERRGGHATPREVMQGDRRFKTTDDAEKALMELVELGYGEWEAPSGGRGRPARRFILSTQLPVYENNAEPEENTNSVDVDTVDDAEESGHWGEV